MESTLTYTASIVALIGAILSIITSIIGKDVIPNQAQKHKNRIILFLLFILLVGCILFPVVFIFKSIYYATSIDKNLLISIIIYSFSFLLNIFIQFYFWIKRVQQRADLANERLSKFLDGINKVNEKYS